tara:strand:+ start:22 stop:135 length:114 start_codon:yes stop_codon:yes gene_type:complete
MSEEQTKAYLEKIEADSSLQEKIKDVVDYDSVVKIAK